MEIRIPLDCKVKGKEVTVVIAKKHLKVGKKGSPLILDGPLFKAVQTDECTWLIEDGNTIVVSMDKVDKMGWWGAIMEGDTEINTKKVSPENSKLSDLDGETRGMVEKMMYVHFLSSETSATPMPFLKKTPACRRKCHPCPLIIIADVFYSFLRCPTTATLQTTSNQGLINDKNKLANRPPTSRKSWMRWKCSRSSTQRWTFQT